MIGKSETFVRSYTEPPPFIPPSTSKRINVTEIIPSKTMTMRTVKRKQTSRNRDLDFVEVYGQEIWGVVDFPTNRLRRNRHSPS